MSSLLANTSRRRNLRGRLKQVLQIIKTTPHLSILIGQSRGQRLFEGIGQSLESRIQVGIHIVEPSIDRSNVLLLRSLGGLEIFFDGCNRCLQSIQLIFILLKARGNRWINDPRHCGAGICSWSRPTTASIRPWIIPILPWVIIALCLTRRLRDCACQNNCTLGFVLVQHLEEHHIAIHCSPQSQPWACAPLQ